jgi:DNA-binding MurR/RpiR family transcriptional regulator
LNEYSILERSADLAEQLQAPETLEELRAAIVAEHGSLSKRLQQIGRYVLDQPNDIALETLAVIASRCGVQPSAIVRFAKSFGFDGASQMQRLFRDELVSNNAALGYSERVRKLDQAMNASGVQPGELLGEFVEGNQLALQGLLQSVSGEDMERAVQAIIDARSVYVAGYRRSFPVASYLAYSLLQAGKRTVFVDGVGGLEQQQIRLMDQDDLLIAISFQPYASEAVAAVEAAADRKGKIMAISDSLVSPIAKRADLVLQVRESEVRGFRSLSASMCLAQAMIINYAFEINRTPAPAAARKTRSSHAKA